MNEKKTIVDYINRKELRWDQRCTGLEGMLRHNLLSYTIQPVPYPGKVDFAAVFFSREKLVKEDIKLGGKRLAYTLCVCCFHCLFSSVL